MLDNENRNPETLQMYSHPSLDVAFVRANAGGNAKHVTATVRLYLPEIRIRHRVAIVFEADDGSHPDISSLANEVQGFACIKTRNGITRVGELWGKNGIPLQFPKSNIDGIMLETQADTPFIDLVVTVGNPEVNGRWAIYYHCTSDNKLKTDEWNRYISQVTAEILGATNDGTIQSPETRVLSYDVG